METTETSSPVKRETLRWPAFSAMGFAISSALGFAKRTARRTIRRTAKRPTVTKDSAEPLVKRNFLVNGRRISMRLEPPMWDALSDIARREYMSVSELCSKVEQILSLAAVEQGQKPADSTATLPDAVRVFIIAYFRRALLEALPDKEMVTGTMLQGSSTRLDCAVSDKHGSVDSLIGCVDYRGPTISVEDMNFAVGQAIAERWRQE